MTTLFKRVGDTMGHHELRVLGTHGDTRTIWNPREPEEVAAARATFDRLKRNKFSIFKVGQDGEKGELMDAFDPNAAKLIAVPPIAGGAEPPGAGRMLSELMRTSV